MCIQELIRLVRARSGHVRGVRCSCLSLRHNLLFAVFSKEYENSL